MKPAYEILIDVMSELKEFGIPAGSRRGNVIRAAQLLFSLTVLFWLERQCPEKRFIRRNKLRPAPMWRKSAIRGKPAKACKAWAAV